MRGAAVQTGRYPVHVKDWGTDVLDPHPRALHAVREAIDGMMSNEADGNVRRIIGSVRANIDKELAAKVRHQSRRCEVRWAYARVGGICARADGS